MEEQIYQDVLVLGQQHCIMTPGLPVNTTAQKATQVHETKYQERSKSDIQSFGLWGSGINYNTYYPDANEADLSPTDAEYVEPLFRLISACILAKNSCPTDFSAPGLLKKSMSLLKGQSVYCDHDTDVGNAVGVVKDTSWQEQTVQDGVVVPAGINGILRIDGKANPRIARGVMSDPPSIHSNSVTVTFRWKPSHQFENKWEFWDKLGTIHEDGTMVRRLVTEIISYAETSLVSHGADPFAQKIVGDKLNHLKYASSVYYDKMENSDKIKPIIEKNLFQNFDYRNGSTDTMLNSNNNQPMNQLQDFLSSLFGNSMLSLSEGQTASAELVASKIKSMVAENGTLKATLETQANQLKESQNSIDGYKTTIANLTAAADAGKSYLAETRNSCLENYKKVNETPDEAIIKLISDESTSVQVLKALNSTYQSQLEAKYPLTCNECGSHQVSRSSSVSEGTEEHSHTSSHSASQADDSNSMLEQMANIAKSNKQ